ncbi:MAG TPA: class I SAM-dependent methyltransferase [Pseudonocardia sp.]|jgi:2-polyprenyl-3-methyl-5-hydroxy-6-metoxy-1,4-benzoquinol methylase|nr:class I SAM-dependent methyltransferase [Pseudonocardia sp.]
MTVVEPASRSDQPLVDEALLGQLVGQVISDVGGALTAPLALLGDRLGLFRMMAEKEVVTSAELAAHSGCVERYVREWLLTMAAAGYVQHLAGEPGADDPATARYRLTPEQAEVFTNQDSPAYVVGAFQNLTAATRALDRLTEAFRTGAGMGWHEHHSDMFEGTERFFRPGYLAHLTTDWIPAITGMAQRLAEGARAADIGCGFGASTIILAQAYPATRWTGFDYHQESIDAATRRATRAGDPDNLEFRCGTASEVSGRYDFIAFFDCLHDMPDPVDALRTARSALAQDGAVMLVEPMSWDTVGEALNPLGRLLSGASLLICLPSGLSEPPAMGLGNQAGPARTCELAREAGFGTARVATSTPFNLVYELRP